MGEAKRKAAAAAKDTNIFVGTNVYRGMCHFAYAAALLGLSQTLSEAGIGMTVCGSETTILERGRNELLSRFFYGSDASHMLFVDSDMAFPAELILKMLRLGEDFVAASYPSRNIMVKDDGYVVGTIGWPMPGGERKAGFVEANYCGFGLVLLKRSGVATMIETYPKLKYSDTTYRGPFPLHNLFACATRDTGESVNEDIAYCLRWRECGGRIWLNADVVVEHHGNVCIAGSVDVLPKIVRPRWKEGVH